MVIAQPKGEVVPGCAGGAEGWSRLTVSVCAPRNWEEACGLVWPPSWAASQVSGVTLDSPVDLSGRYPEGCQEDQGDTGGKRGQMQPRVLYRHSQFLPIWGEAASPPQPAVSLLCDLRQRMPLCGLHFLLG